MILIDNGYGFSVNNCGRDGDNMNVRTNNIKVYGETDVRDCPTSNYCSGNPMFDKEICLNKAGMIVSYFCTGAKPPFPRGGSALP